MSCRARFAFAAGLCALALTSGCDNAVEHLTVEEWREVGTAEAPSSDAAYIVTTLVPGEERAVRAGELVQLRVVTPNGSEHEVTVWTGAAATPPRVLGAEGLRAALIGRRVGERFAIGQPYPGSEVPWLPLHGAMSTLELPGLSWTWVEDDVRIRARDWPRVDLARTGGEPGDAQIEVLDSCPARLLHRTATLRQWGYVVEPFARRLPPRRAGALHWFAFEAVCADGARRLQVGPLYADGDSFRALNAWEASYVRLRPPTRFPEEWEVTPLR